MRTSRSILDLSPALTGDAGADGPASDPGVRSGGAEAPLGLRVKVYMRRWRLDREIAAGHDPQATGEHALRACQLDSPRTRRAVATALRDAIDYSEHVRSRGLNSSAAIEAAAAPLGGAIEELAARLESPGSVNPRGVALARMLACDGLSPLFKRGSEHTVTAAAREAIDTLAVASTADSLAA